MFRLAVPCPGEDQQQRLAGAAEEREEQRCPAAGGAAGESGVQQTHTHTCLTLYMKINGRHSYLVQHVKESAATDGKKCEALEQRLQVRT